MTTLGDLIWAVATEVAQAMSEGRVPGLASAGDLEALQRANDALQRSFETCRLEYSKELFELRDQLRALPEGFDPEILVEEPTYRFEPNHHMTEELQKFIDMVVEEKVKLMMLKGVSGDRKGMADLQA